MVAQYVIARKKGEEDGSEAARKWFNDNTTDDNGVKTIRGYPPINDHNAENFGFKNIYEGGRSRMMDNYRWGWVDGIEETMSKLYADFYDPDGNCGKDTIKEHDLVSVTGKYARAIEKWCNDNKKEFELYIRCTVCHRISRYGGYPTVPEVSSIICTRCYSVGPEGGMYIPRALLNESAIQVENY